MGGSVNNTEPLFGDMSVSLCGREVGVAEQLLDRSQVGTTVEKMGGEGVAQRVRVRRGCRPPVDDAPHIAGAEPCPPPVEEHRVGRASPRVTRCSAAPLQPARDRLDGRLAHRDLALLRALAPDGDRAGAQVEVARRRARTARPPAGRCRRAARAPRRRGGGWPRRRRRPLAGGSSSSTLSSSPRSTRGSRDSPFGACRPAAGSASMRPVRASHAKYRRSAEAAPRDRARPRSGGWRGRRGSDAAWCARPARARSARRARPTR